MLEMDARTHVGVFVNCLLLFCFNQNWTVSTSFGEVVSYIFHGNLLSASLVVHANRHNLRSQYSHSWNCASTAIPRRSSGVCVKLNTSSSLENSCKCAVVGSGQGFASGCTTPSTGRGKSF